MRRFPNIPGTSKEIAIIPITVIKMDLIYEETNSKGIVKRIAVRDITEQEMPGLKDIIFKAALIQAARKSEIKRAAKIARAEKKLQELKGPEPKPYNGVD